MATGSRLGSFVQSIGNLGTGLIIAFIAGWKLTLVLLALMPFVILGAMMQIRVLAGASGKNKEALESAGRVSVESIENIRTIASLTKEDHFLLTYVAELEPALKNTIHKAHAVGFSFAISQSVMYLTYAVAFYYGGVLIEDREMDFGDVFRVFSCVMFGCIALGQSAGFAPDVGKAQTAARRIFAILETMPDNAEEILDIGTKPLPGTFKSGIYFKDVHFAYKIRPNVKVLQGLSISVEPGQTVALVGSSGCGKSTTISLIERFYNPTQGAVYLDQHMLGDLSVQWLRRQIGLVSQEPVLFGCSIAENIAYGDLTRVVPMEEIIKAAKNANIHNFIEALPLGYDTQVGDRGTQLSGGQKQRVAIARALLRNPKILLLDEATSALDTESEKIVQEAIDKAKTGRTCITIAHRLSTIVDADKIIVFDRGVVAEQGTHQELMAKQGLYYNLHMIQAKRR